MVKDGEIEYIKDIVYSEEEEKFVNERVDDDSRRDDSESGVEENSKKYLFYSWYKYVNNSNK